MATTLIGHIETFDPDADDWPQYIERMEEMFKVFLLKQMILQEKAKRRRGVSFF